MEMVCIHYDSHVLYTCSFLFIHFGNVSFNSELVRGIGINPGNARMNKENYGSIHMKSAFAWEILTVVSIPVELLKIIANCG
jgi:hypothetical protein